MSKDLNPETLEVSKLVLDVVSVDKTGTATGTSDVFNTYAESKGVTKDIINQVDDVRSTFAAGSVHACGHLAVDAMAKHKEVDRVSFEFPVGKKDTFSISVDRHKQFSNHLTGGEPTDKYGVVTAQWDQYAGKNAGQLKKAKVEIAEYGLSKLK